LLVSFVVGKKSRQTGREGEQREAPCERWERNVTKRTKEDRHPRRLMNRNDRKRERGGGREVLDGRKPVVLFLAVFPEFLCTVSAVSAEK